MKKRIAGVLMALAIMIGGGVTLTMMSDSVNACDKCNVKSDDARERVCGSCKKKGMTKQGAVLKNGYWHITYKCDHCSHTTVRKTKNIYEI